MLCGVLAVNSTMKKVDIIGTPISGQALITKTGCA